MATTKIFLTGASGYIGGAALDHIYTAHPDYEYTLLVSDEKRGKPIKDKYPNVEFVYGTFDDNADGVEKAAANADIVVHTADSSDNVAGARAIARGLHAGHDAHNPAYWIHVSGTSILTWYDADNQRFGQAPLPEQKYWDIQSIDRIVDFPDSAHHRNVDKIVQASASDAVKPAIVCPPTIYGVGPGAINTRSRQVPDMASNTLQKGFAPVVAPGDTEWDHVHIDDLGDLFLLLVDAARDPLKRDEFEIFGPRGYFFAESGSHRWADVAKAIADAASRQGYLPAPLTKSVSQKEAHFMDGVSTPSYGLNSKGVAERARKYLAWQPGGASLKDTIADIVAREAKALGLTPKEKKA